MRYFKQRKIDHNNIQYIIIISKFPRILNNYTFKYHFLIYTIL